MSKLKVRNIFLLVAPIIIMLTLLVTDPYQGLIQNLPFGTGLVTTLTLMTRGILIVTIGYLLRKVFFDYIEADFKSLGAIARETSVGAGLYALAIMLFTSTVMIVLTLAMVM